MGNFVPHEERYLILHIATWNSYEQDETLSCSEEVITSPQKQIMSDNSAREGELMLVD